MPLHRIGTMLCLLGLWVLPAFSYDVVLKNGRTLKGTVVREDSEVLLLKDASGIQITIKKVNIDLSKTADANKPAPKPAAPSGEKKKARVYTKEDLERLREKYNLGTESFGKSSKVEFKVDFEKAPASSEEDRDFQSIVLESSIPVLVDFWAPWCGPCREVSPRVEAVAAEFSGKARVHKVNIDEQPVLARRYQVEAIPTLLFFKNGEIVGRIVGASPQHVIAKKLGSLID